MTAGIMSSVTILFTADSAAVISSTFVLQKKKGLRVIETLCTQLIVEVTALGDSPY
jgi:hypothetical protein